DTLALPTTHYTYELGAPLSKITTEQRETSGEPGVLVSHGFVDGLGRSRGVTHESTGRRWLLSDFVSFDARGNVNFNAFDRTISEPALPLVSLGDGVRNRRDALGRLVVTEHLDGATERTEYAPLRRSVWDGNDSDPGSQHFDTPTTYEYDGLERLRAVIERESIAEYRTDRKSTRLNSSHVKISYAVFCL